MSNFDRQSLEHLKTLCRIECSEAEDADALYSLQRILDYMAQLNEIDTEAVPACRYVLRGMQHNEMRADEVKDRMSRDTFLSNTPDQIGGMVRVPPVLTPSS